MGVSSPRFAISSLAAPADRGVGIVVNLAAGDVRQLCVKQRGQGAQDAALGLPAQSEQNEIMARKNGVDDLGHYGVVIADDAGKNGAASAKLDDQVVAHFVFHAPGIEDVVR